MKPRSAQLGKFARLIMPDLPIKSVVMVKTRNTLYTLTKFGTLNWTIRGHERYCPIDMTAEVPTALSVDDHLVFTTLHHKEFIRTSRIETILYFWEEE